MGISWSKRHNHHNNRPHYPSIPQSSPLSTSNPPMPNTLPTPTIPQPFPPPHLPPPNSSNQSPQVQSVQPPSYAFAANAPHPTTPAQEQHPYPALPPPPPPPPLPPYSFNNYNYNFSNYRPMNNTGQYTNYRPYYMPQINGWGPSVGPYPPPPPTPPLPPVPYVDHQSAKKIKNDVNVHKDTIRLQLDELNPDCHLVSFTFDALVDGSITIFYFAKEGPHCTFNPVYPEIVPVKIPFQKGLGQKFCQQSGTGVDLGFFDTDDLSKPFSGEDVYPLVISAESFGQSMPMDNQSNQEMINASSHAQISQAVLERKNEGDFHVRVIKQILWIDGVRYELREIFGISNSDETAINDIDLGKECVICMTETKNTAVLPCRHLCMCSECAKELRLQSNKCPICRQPIEELLEIKVDEEAGA